MFVLTCYTSLSKNFLHLDSDIQHINAFPQLSVNFNLIISLSISLSIFSSISLIKMLSRKATSLVQSQISLLGCHKTQINYFGVKLMDHMLLHHSTHVSSFCPQRDHKEILQKSIYIIILYSLCIEVQYQSKEEINFLWQASSYMFTFSFHVANKEHLVHTHCTLEVVQALYIYYFI